MIWGKYSDLQFHFLKKVSIIKNKHLQNAAMKTFYTPGLYKSSHQRDLRTKNQADFFKYK